MNLKVMLASTLAGCAALVAVAPVAAQAAPATRPVTQRPYIAAGQYLRGSALYKPACKGRFSCGISGDATAFLYKMRWTQWSATKAVGTGTYVLNSCTPNCAEGRFYSVPIVVTFTNPVRACVGKSVRRYWTKATFRFTHGLPPALRGNNAPVNPWVFGALIQEAKASCHHA